jgi:Lon protease-like protein
MASLQLPDKMGAILLPDCTLFPHGALPLHIFEPRYRRMLEDALESDCLFCVGRLTADESVPLEECTAPIGTAALIRASREQADGRSNLVIHGVARVRFLEWLPSRPYPFSRIEPVVSAPLAPHQAPLEYSRLRDAVEQVLLGLPSEVQNEVETLLDRTTDPAIMSDAIAQQFVHEPPLRAQLLEELDVSRRIGMIIDHLNSLRSG